MASCQIEQIIKDGETTPSIDDNELLGGHTFGQMAFQGHISLISCHGRMQPEFQN
jgi:hypothetical protein